MPSQHNTIMKKLLTLGLLVKNGKILLGMKKRGFGAGRWNGFGGKLNEGETLQDAAIREYYEESTIKPTKIEKVGNIEFVFEGQEQTLDVHFFKIIEYTGTETETEEMKPEWFDFDKIPFENMWPDDRHWMPLFLAGKKFKGTILFKDSNTIIKTEIKEVKNIE